jgi:hypothetical protein
MQFANQYPSQDNTENFADDLNLTPPDEETPTEGDWNDEEDEDFDDQTESRNDLHEIQVDDDLGEPDAEEDDHLPDEELQ